MKLNFFQVALVSTDLPASIRLYHQAFGFLNGGAQCSWGSKIQALSPDARHVMWWLVGDQPFFQLELFAYTYPQIRALPDDWTPADHGWTRFGVEVVDFDDCLAVLGRYGIAPLGPIVTGDGRRRAAVRDPHVGVIIEVIEGATSLKGPFVRHATSSVSDLDAARRFYGETLGHDLLPLDHLHTPADEALWGLAGVERDGFVVVVDDGYLEIVRYSTGRPKPQDWRLSDQGVQNIALGSRDRTVIEKVLEKVSAAGHPPPYIFDNGANICGYVNDHEREIEFASIPESMDVPYGFKPLAIGFFGGRNDKL